MKAGPKIATVAALLLLAALGGALLGYRLGGAGAASGSAAVPSPGAAPVAGGGPVAGPRSAERRVLYWFDPMVPNQRFDHPGKSPFMDMPLQPRYAEDVPTQGGLHIDPAVTQNLGVRTATVERALESGEISVPVSVQLNDRLVAVVQSRGSGFVERAWPLAPGDIVAAGAPLVELLLPEWAGAQAEFLAMLRTGDETLADAGRRRLELLGMSMALIERVERSGVVEAKQIVTAPISGMLQTLDVRSGMTVASGATLARINGLASVWLEAAVPASQAAGIVPGTPLAARFAAFPGEVLHARVQAVLPEANLEARTLRVRAETAGHRGLLPGLVGEARLAPRGPGPQLLIPSEALIRTGTRELVIRALADGHFQAVEVRTGGEAQGRVAILAGLEEGWQVVVSGQFLIDSEASLKGVMTRLKSAGQLP